MSWDPSVEPEIIDIIRTAAKAEILPRFRNLDASDITAKTGPDDLVTAADKASEEAITAALAPLFPQALIVGEEAAEDDPSLVSQIADADLAIILDPIDGTWNFARGLSNFGVILAVTSRDETLFGLLYDPVLDDWVITRKGGGTWFGRPDAEPRKLMMNGGPKAGFRGFAAPYLFEPETHTRLLQDFYSLGRTHSLRCSCHEYRLMSFGHAAFCLAAAPKPWDHAAGLLAVTEAGGVAGRLDGAPYQPSRRDIPLITAATPEIFGEVQNKLAWLLPA